MNARRIDNHTAVIRQELAHMGVPVNPPLLQELITPILHLTDVADPQAIRTRFEQAGGRTVVRANQLLLAGPESAYLSLLPQLSEDERARIMHCLETNRLSLTGKGRWKVRDREWLVGRRTCIMGVLNVTPDSFSDGGLYDEPSLAVEHAVEMVEAGADIIDIGGESSRPGADPVPVADEIQRVAPVIQRLAERSAVLISVDTCKSEVAREAIQAGAHIVNDIRALTDPGMLEVVADTQAGVVLMHMQGTPQTMQRSPEYGDVIADIHAFLHGRIMAAEAEGIRREQIVVDPGIGFGKTMAHNFRILNELATFRSLGRPILVGTSRKSFIGKILNQPADQRVFGTAATVTYAISRGADIVRVHDVPEMKQIATMTDALNEAAYDRHH